MTPKWLQEEKSREQTRGRDFDITKPVPLPRRYDPIAPMHEEVFDKYVPLKKRKNQLKPPRRSRPAFNQGRL